MILLLETWKEVQRTADKACVKEYLKSEKPEFDVNVNFKETASKFGGITSMLL